MLPSILRIIALTRKELLSILKDRRARLSLFLPPIIQGLVFGYAATYDLNHVPYAVMDLSQSAASRELLAGLDGSRVFQRVADLHRPEEIRNVIDGRGALLVLQINQDFERRLLAGQGAVVQVIADGRNSNTAGIANSYIGAIVNAFNNRWRADHDLPGPTLQVVDRAWFNPNMESVWNMLPGMIGTLTLMQTLMLTVMAVAREREQGTFDQLQVTPFRPYEIMAGKALPSMMIGLVQATGVLIVAQVWFRIPFAGSLFTLYTGLLFFLLAAVGMGLLLSSVARSMQQAMLYSMLFIMPFSVLSGLTTPISNMPGVLRTITVINPLSYAIDIARRVYLEGVGLDVISGDLWPLALIAAITLTGASWIFSNRSQ